MKLNFTSIVSCSFLLLAGCASVTHEKVNTVTRADTVSPIITQAQTRVLKRKVAIARFTDETKRSSSFFINEDGSKLGKQASDILAARLTESGKFIMFERDDLEKVVREQDYAKLAGQNIGADYLIVGSISEFGRSSESDVGVFNRNKIQLAHATVNLRLIDTTTGQIVFAQEGKGEARSEASTVMGVGQHAGYNSDLDDKAVSAAISKITSNVMENLLEKPWHAFLLKGETNQLFLTGGPAQNVKAGDQFRVMKRGGMVKNPQTGMSVELPGVQVASIKVTGAVGQGDNELSLCEVVSGNIQGYSLDKLVVQEL
jgi:curli biogenesis system outer membrane secretion channel CsgG